MRCCEFNKGTIGGISSKEENHSDAKKRQQKKKRNYVSLPDDPF